MNLQRCRKIANSDTALFLLLFFSYAYFFQGGFANQNSHFDLTSALAFEHRMTIDSFHPNTVDKVLFNGHYFSEKAPGASYLSLPLPILVSLFVSAQTLFAHPQWANWLLYASTVLSVSLLSAFAGVCFGRALRLLNPERTPTEAHVLSAAIYLGTLILPYSTLLFGHQVAGALLVIGLTYGLNAALEIGSLARNASIAVFCLGFSVFCEYPVAPLAVLLSAGLLCVAKRPARMIRYAPIALIPAAMLMAHNALSFGSPFSLGYGKLEGTQFASQMSQGFFGIALPRWDRLLQLTVGRYRGLFYYSPILALALGSYFFWPRPLLKKLGVFFLAAAVTGLLLNASYGYWQGGVCFGPRHLVTIIPLLGMGFAYFPSARLRRPEFVALALISVAINLVGTATTPFVSEYDTDPLFNSYKNLVLDGGISLNPIDFLCPLWSMGEKWAQPSLHQWAAFNLGELTGLSGVWSLLPLLVVWALFFVLKRTKA